jgi:hypothetical protein
MNKLLRLSVPVLFSVLALGAEAPTALAAFPPTLTAATVSGGSSVIVLPSTSISASVTGTAANAGHKWSSVKWGLVSGSIVSTCIDIADISTTASTTNFSVISPASAGTYNANFQGFTDAVCSTDPSVIFSLANAIVVKNNQAPLTVTGLLGSAAYAQAGVTAGTSGGSGTGTVTFSSGASTACSINSSTGVVNITSAVGTCSITATKATDSAYFAATSAPVSITVSKATPTATLTVSNSAVYDGSAHSATVSITVSSILGAVANLLGAINVTNAGNYAVTADFVPSDPINYATLTSLSAGNFVISKADQTITVNTHAPGSAIYGTSFSVAASSDSTLPVAVTTTGGCSVSSGTVTMTSGTSDCVVHYNQAGNGNYNAATEVTETVTAQKVALTITAASDSKTYDGAAFSVAVPTITSGALVGSDAANFTEAYDSRDVGTGKTLTPSGTVTDGNSGANYTYSFVNNTSGAITTRAITVTAASDSKVYDGNTTSAGVPTVTAGSLVGGDSITGFTQSFDTKNVGTLKTLTPAGTVTDGNNGDNYDVTLATDATGVITTRAITVTANALSKTYGDADPALTYGVTGTLASGDSFSGSLSRASGEDVGSYAVTQGTLSLGTNYDLTFVGNSFSVSPKAVLTVTANDKAITYGQSDPSFDFAYSGFKLSDDASVIDTAPTCGVTGSHTAAGSYSIVCSAGSDNNYDFSYVAGTLTVNKAPLTVSGLTAQDKVYDSMMNVTLNSGATLSGVVSGDSANVALDSSAATGTFANKDVAANKTVTTSGFALTGSSKNNYTLSQPTVTADITPAALTVTGVAAQDKTYDATTAATLNVSSAALSGAYAGDSVSLDTSTKAGAFADKHIGSGKPVTVTGLAITGTDSGDYSLTAPIGVTATIASAALTITAQTNTKSYDGTASASASPVASGLQGSDSVTGAMEVYTDTNAGTGKMLSVSAYTVNDGNSGNNYTVSPVDDATGVITAVPLSVTANDQTKTYDNVAYSGGNGVTYSGFVNGETSTVLGGSLSFSGTSQGATDAGSYVITPSGETSGNYTITYNDGTLTIGMADPVINVVGYSVTYDGTSHTAPITATGALGLDLSSKLDLSATTHTNAGTYSSDAWSFAGDANYNSQSGTVSDDIAKANATIGVTPYIVVDDGQSHTAIGSATGVLGEALLGLDLSATTHSILGLYTDEPWTFTDVTGNYNDDHGLVIDFITPFSGSGGGSGLRPAGQVLGVSTTTVATSTTTMTMGSTSAEMLDGTKVDVATTTGMVLGVEKFNFTKNLRYHTTDSDVAELQKALIAAGFPIPGATTNYFGSGTLAAVKAFQKAHSLPETGWVGPMTRGVLNGTTSS